MSQDTTDLATSPIYLPLTLTHNSSAPHLLSGLMMSSLNVMRDTYPPAAAALVATPSLEAVAVGGEHARAEFQGVAAYRTHHTLGAGMVKYDLNQSGTFSNRTIAR